MPSLPMAPQMITQMTTPYAALLLRLSLGAVLLAHGAWLKLGVFGLPGTMGFFGSIGFSPILGAVVALGETAAGLALISGILVRPAALLTLPIMLGATAMHAGDGWLLPRPMGVGNSPPS